MNVLIAVPWDQETGGVASVVGHLAEQLRKRGDRVLFLHPAPRRWPRPKVTKWGFPGYELNIRSPTSPPTLRARLSYALTLPATLVALLWILIRHRIDVVNVHYPSAMFGYFARLRRLLPRLRLVVSLHGTDVVRSWPDDVGVDAMTAGLLASADAVVTPSAGFARQCDAVLRELAARTLVIHNGVTPDEFSAPASARDPGTILTVASLDRWKGLDVLIRSFALLWREDEGRRLLIAGVGPEYASLEALVTELRLGHAVEFLGHVDRPTLRKLLATCTVFVLASRSEPFGIAAAEALAAGAPVVASDIGGLPELLGGGTHGVLVPPDDVPALAGALSRLFHDAGLRQRLSAAGPPRVAAEFQWEFTGRKYSDLFQALLVSGYSG